VQANETAALFERDRTYIRHDAGFLPSSEHPIPHLGAKIINRNVSVLKCDIISDSHRIRSLRWSGLMQLADKAHACVW